MIHILARVTTKVLLIVIAALALGRAYAGHVPIHFYNVTNWYSGGEDNGITFGQKMLAHQFKTPDTAFQVDWSKNVSHCPNGSDTYIYLDAFPSTAGSDNAYDAHYDDYAQDADCLPPLEGPWRYGSSAIKYTACGTQVTEPAITNGPDTCPALELDPDKNRGNPSCPCVVRGDPVNVATGNKVEEIEVYRGNGPFPLDFRITYNSANGNSNSVATNDLVLGIRRVHSYMQSVTVYSNGSTSTAYVLRPNGRVLAFDNSGTSWIPDADVGEALSASYAQDGTIAGWSLTDGGKQQELYDAQGKLTALVQRGGLSQTLAYDSNGKLTSITDPQGRKLVLAYDAQNRISDLTSPANGSYAFSYDTNDNLSSITYPDSTTIQFFYNESGGSGYPNSHGNLTSVVDESGTKIDSTVYDVNDRVSSTTKPAGVDSTNFVYTLDSHGYATSDVVTHALGMTETIGVEYQFGVAKPNMITRACQGCSSATRQYAYDVNGRLSGVTDFNGNITKTTYDANGLLDQQIDASGTPSQRTTNTTWNTTLHV
ncbi:DUF6531 domain-containing protein, partial [Rhodanobacter sp. Si-c]